jgi:hypothetical protein
MRQIPGVPAWRCFIRSMPPKGLCDSLSSESDYNKLVVSPNEWNDVSRMVDVANDGHEYDFVVFRSNLSVSVGKSLSGDVLGFQLPRDRSDDFWMMHQIEAVGQLERFASLPIGLFHHLSVQRLKEDRSQHRTTSLTDTLRQRLGGIVNKLHHVLNPVKQEQQEDPPRPSASFIKTNTASRKTR